MRRQSLYDEEWAKIQHLMPSNDGRGRGYRDHREVVGGIIWAMRSGARWLDIPREPLAP